MTIIGRITEAETGDPVVNAQVAFDGRGRAITDSDGRYRIEGVEAGRHTISVTSIGHRRASREVEVSDGTTATADFTLDVLPSQLDEVVVTVRASSGCASSVTWSGGSMRIRSCRRHRSRA